MRPIEHGIGSELCMFHPQSVGESFGIHVDVVWATRCGQRMRCLRHRKAPSRYCRLNTCVTGHDSSSKHFGSASALNAQRSIGV